MFDETGAVTHQEPITVVDFATSALGHLAVREVDVIVTELDAEGLSGSRNAPLSQHANRVVFELTERASGDTVPDLRERVARLRAMGFRIAIDDHGAGYAGLQYFTQLAPDFAFGRPAPNFEIATW